MTDIKAVLRAAGIVGAGGAGFPSYAKLAEGADTLIVNGSECEPLLHTDYEIIKQHIREVVAGAEMIAGALGIKTVICTDISKDGALSGTNLERYDRLRRELSINIIASGGITTLDDLRALSKMDLYGAIVGRVLYTGAMNVRDALNAVRNPG